MAKEITKRRAQVRDLAKKRKKLSPGDMKKVRGGELKSVLVTSVREPAKSASQTKLMEEEGIY